VGTATSEREVADYIKEAVEKTTVGCTKMVEQRKCENICTGLDVIGRRKWEKQSWEWR
jgi:hypothetical protein